MEPPHSKIVKRFEEKTFKKLLSTPPLCNIRGGHSLCPRRRLIEQLWSLLHCRTQPNSRALAIINYCKVALAVVKFQTATVSAYILKAKKLQTKKMLKMCVNLNKKIVANVWK